MEEGRERLLEAIDTRDIRLIGISVAVVKALEAEEAGNRLEVSRWAAEREWFLIVSLETTLIIL